MKCEDIHRQPINLNPTKRELLVHDSSYTEHFCIAQQSGAGAVHAKYTDTVHAGCSTLGRYKQNIVQQYRANN